MKKVFIFAVLLLMPLAAFAAAINTHIPGPYSEESGVGGLVANIYWFSLAFAGLLAFGAIVYGAIKYTASGGNTSLQGDARDQITQALLGLLLLLGAVILLTTLNPYFFQGSGGGFTFSLPYLTPYEAVNYSTCPGGHTIIFTDPTTGAQACQLVSGCGSNEC